MNIVFVFDTFNSGGAGKQFSLLCEGLIQYGHTVKIIVIDGGYYYSLFRNMYIDIVLVKRKYRFDIAPLFSMSGIIREFKPDIVHAWGWMSTLSANIICKLSGIPLVGSLRTATISEKPLAKLISKLNIFFISSIVSNSKAALITNNIPKSKGNVVYNGFDFSTVPSDGIMYDKFTVVMSARMSKEKDWNCFIEAISILHSRQITKNIHFVGLGDGVIRNIIHAEAKIYIDSGILELPGYVKEPMRWMINAKAGVLVSSPGILEGTSNSILEYMACSLPIVSTGTGGNTETVVDGKTGFFIPSSDSLQLADRIQFLFENQDVATKMGIAANNYLHETYTFKNMIEQTIKIYEDLLSKS